MHKRICGCAAMEGYADCAVQNTFAVRQLPRPYGFLSALLLSANQESGADWPINRACAFSHLTLTTCCAAFMLLTIIPNHNHPETQRLLHLSLEDLSLKSAVDKHQVTSGLQQRSAPLLSSFVPSAVLHTLSLM